MRILIALLLCLPLGARDYYVSKTGTDSNDCLSFQTACATFAHVDSLMSPGDTMNIGDGTYCEQLCPTVTGGSAEARITYRAVNDGRVVIDSAGIRPSPIDVGGACGGWAQTHYVTIEGLVAINGSQDTPNLTGAVVRTYRDHGIFRRLSGYNADKDGNTRVMSVYGKDNLVEDCVFGGYGRKMVQTAGHGPMRNIFRRVFAAWMEWPGNSPYDPGNWPWGDGIESDGAGSIIFENNIVFGRVPGLNPFGSSNQTGSAVTNQAYLGNMVIYAGRHWDGATQMTWQCPNPHRDPPNRCKEFPGNTRAGFRFHGGEWENILIQDHLSYGNAGDGFAASVVRPARMTNLTLIRATAYGNDQSSNEDGVQVDADFFSHVDKIADTYIQDNERYQGGGARLKYRYRSRFSGDMPEPNLTSTELWPWPMEERIRSEFNTYLYPIWGAEEPELHNFSVTSTTLGIFRNLPSEQNPLGEAPRISTVVDNRGDYSNDKIPLHSKFEITFQVPGTTATSTFFPYDASPPPVSIRQPILCMMESQSMACSRMMTG